MLSQLFAQSNDAPASLGMGFWIFIAIVVIISVIGLWKVFTKAGHPGWAALIPFYNSYIMVQIAQRPIWWFIGSLIPYVNIVFAILIGIEIAKRFGKSPVFGGIVCGLLSIGYIIIGFDKSTYNPNLEASTAGTIADTPYPTNTPTPPTTPVV